MKILLIFSLFLLAVVSLVNGSRLFHSLNDNNKKTNGKSSSSSSFMANWMGELAPIISNYSLMDISIPGSHDTLTYDLSTTFADNANDLPDWVAYLLHQYHNIITDLEISNFVRDMARTQGLTITQQLENGLRFVDLRVDYTAGPNSPSNGTYDWYGMHMMQTKNKAVTYMQQIRQFLDDHPTEVIIVWVSHHGSPCDTHYNVPNPALWKLWNDIESIFGGIMFDFSQGNLNETTIQTMLNRGQRAAFYMADYRNVTNSSKFAQSSCNIDNSLPGDSNPVDNIQNLVNRFDNAVTRSQTDKANNQYYLQSISGPTISAHLIYAFELRFLSKLPEIFNATEANEKCAALYKVPGSTFCGQYLQENALWSNYYGQYGWEYAINKQIKEYQTGNGKQKLTARFPNAIYADAFDVEGTLRIGSQIFFPNDNSSSSQKHQQLPSFEVNQLDAKYAYADTLLLSNVLLICSGTVGSSPATTQPSQDVCNRFISLLTQRRAKHPMQLWDDLSTGRSSTYPPNPYS